MKQRKVVQITGADIGGIGNLFAVCNDGTIWRMGCHMDGWSQAASIPQPESAKGTEDPVVALRATLRAEALQHLSNKIRKKLRNGPRPDLDSRIAEYGIDAVKAVIDVKCNQWIGNPDMEKYLRPETLFRKSKFESYWLEAQEANPVKERSVLTEAQSNAGWADIFGKAVPPVPDRQKQPQGYLDWMGLYGNWKSQMDSYTECRLLGVAFPGFKK